MKYMEMQNLLNFINEEDKRIRSYYGDYNDQEKRILARTVKLAEEMVELCDELLAYNSLQRNEKMENIKEGNLEEEFADVVITALLLAKSMNIDVETALDKKVKKIKERHSK